MSNGISIIHLDFCVGNPFLTGVRTTVTCLCLTCRTDCRLILSASHFIWSSLPPQIQYRYVFVARRQCAMRSVAWMGGEQVLFC
jgi:hypothetical protein